MGWGVAAVESRGWKRTCLPLFQGKGFPDWVVQAPWPCTYIHPGHHKSMTQAINPITLLTATFWFSLDYHYTLFYREEIGLGFRIPGVQFKLIQLTFCRRHRPCDCGSPWPAQPWGGRYGQKSGLCPYNIERKTLGHRTSSRPLLSPTFISRTLPIQCEDDSARKIF